MNVILCASIRGVGIIQRRYMWQVYNWFWMVLSQEDITPITQKNEDTIISIFSFTTVCHVTDSEHKKQY